MQDILDEHALTSKSKGIIWFTISKTSAPDDYIGLITLMAINPHRKSIKFGVVYSKELQRSAAGTESVFLLLKYCFELGYVRIEWICDIENKASRAAALRYGFKHEGIIRRHLVGSTFQNSYSHSLIDEEWPAIRKEMERWLQPSNFDAEGRQLTKLEAATAV